MIVLIVQSDKWKTKWEIVFKYYLHKASIHVKTIHSILIQMVLSNYVVTTYLIWKKPDVIHNVML